ncbi:MAG: thermonuclease family protein, partial [Candidatus Omnitrophica bacterium]|nr:thermonuclease family protein [Candidatus Omnitrophota bacterium]
MAVFSCSKPLDYSSVKVIEVIDGDTIRLENGKLLRYIGLDTPELRDKKNGNFVFNPQPYSQEAAQYNRGLVEGKNIRVEFDLVQMDKYKRLLGYCFLGDIFINAKLLEEGLAALYTCPPNVKYSQLFVKNQREARQNKKGIWSGHEVVSADKAYQYIGQIRCVRGRVLATYQSKKCVYLNFGSNYKEDFTVVIFNDALEQFRTKGIDPCTFYKDKLI